MVDYKLGNVNILMNDNVDTPKKIKKQKVKDPSINDLAADILKDEDVLGESTESEDIPELPDIPDVPEVSKPTTYGKIPSESKEVKEPPKPVVFKQGMFKPDAFVVKYREDEIFTILGQHFGPRNGDYFIVNENTSTTYIRGRRRRYRCMLVEDKNGFRYGLWFDITSTGPVF